MKILSLLFLLFVCAISAQAQQNLTVDTTADDATLRACTAAANDCSLRGAIANANATLADDTIDFALPAGVNTITLTGGEIIINDAAARAGALTITNSTGASNLLISGNNASRIFYVARGANLTLNGVTVTNGNTGGAGAGIINYGTLTLLNSTVSGNTVTGFGGAGYGGGIFNQYGTLTLLNSTVSGNTARYGGGIYNDGSTTTISNSTVSGNTATVDGGGIYNNSQLTLSNSTVSGNRALNSGGIFNSGTLDLTSVTVAFNVAQSNIAGGVFNAGTANLLNTIVAKNSAFDGPDFYGEISSTSSFNLIGDGTRTTGITNGTNGNQVGTSANPIDPNLGSLDLNGGTTLNHALLTGSPAIDQGNATGTDQRGLTRPIDNPAITNAIGGNGADIGAFELQTVNAVVDADGDGFSDANDNCPNTANASQANNDGDAFGDVCDSDDDNDGVSDEQDAFPTNPNESVDTDGDGIGNNADTDDDGDGQLDGDETACGSNSLDRNSKAADNDADNSPNCVDSDDDNDGVLDTSDAFPFNPNESVDTDKDGMGNNADTDDDNDGQSDADEIACGSNPLNATSKCAPPTTGPPTTIEQCKNGGWMMFTIPRSFKSEKDCIKFVTKGK